MATLELRCTYEGEDALNFQFEVAMGIRTVAIWVYDESTRGPLRWMWRLAGQPVRSRNFVLRSAARALIGPGWTDEEVQPVAAELLRRIEAHRRAAKGRYMAELLGVR